MILDCLGKSGLWFLNPGQAQCQTNCLKVGSYSFSDQPLTPCSLPNTLISSAPAPEGEATGGILISVD